MNQTKTEIEVTLLPVPELLRKLGEKFSTYPAPQVLHNALQILVDAQDEILVISQQDAPNDPNSYWTRAALRTSGVTIAHIIPGLFDNIESPALRVALLMKLSENI